MDLYPFQEDDVRRLVEEPTHAGLVASVVGTGKTLIATEALRRLDAKHALIMAPLNTEDGWRRHLLEVMDCPLRKIGNGSAEERDALADLVGGTPGFYFTGWEFARKSTVVERRVSPVTGKVTVRKQLELDLRDVPLDALVADEVHRAQNRKSDQGSFYQRTAHSILRRDGHVYAMSGTPAGNHLSGMFGVANGLWPERYPYYSPWTRQFFTFTFNRWSGFDEPANERVPGAVVAHLPLYIRHEMGRQCCSFHPLGVQADLPPVVVHKVHVDLTPTQLTIYKQLEREMFAWVEEHEFPLKTRGMPAIHHLRLAQIAMAVPTPEMVKIWKTDPATGDRMLADSTHVSYALDTKSSKIEALLDIAMDLGDEPFMVYTHSAAIIPAIVDRLRKRRIVAEGWHGGVNHAARDQIKGRFGHATQAIVAQIGSIGEGVDGLQRVCNNEIWLSEEANNLLNIQCRGRLSRTGQTKTVNRWLILAENTVEVESWYDRSEQELDLRESLHAAHAM